MVLSQGIASQRAAPQATCHKRLEVIQPHPRLCTDHSTGDHSLATLAPGQQRLIHPSWRFMKEKCSRKMLRKNAPEKWCRP